MYYLSQDKWKCRFAKYHSSIGSLKPIINVAIKPKIQAVKSPIKQQSILSVLAVSGRPDKPMEVAPTWKNAWTAPPKAPPIQAEMNGLPSGKVTP